MPIESIDISPIHWEMLWENLSESGSHCFRSDREGDSYWRQFQAINPMKTFILDDISELALLQNFLQENADKLCAGFFSYDLGLMLHKVKSRHARALPLAVFHAFDEWLEFANGVLKIDSQNDEYIVRVKEILQGSEIPQAVRTTLQFETPLQPSKYASQIDRIHDYIRAGDFYQINYTQMLESQTVFASRSLYSRLLQKHPASYACHFAYDDVAIHSLSPELFLHYSEGRLTTEPIKGTRPRGLTPEDDKRRMEELLESQKEQAELYMITDLLRNDLGAVCAVGSVELEAVKELRKLPKVWHTFSRISGNLQTDIQPFQALISMLPGGSITGCPKKRALEVIDELELCSRGIYTGALGYYHPDGNSCFNIAIRTLIQRGTQLRLGSGGGITIDSNWEDEWDELRVKASTFE